MYIYTHVNMLEQRLNKAVLIIRHSSLLKSHIHTSFIREIVVFLLLAVAAVLLLTYIACYERIKKSNR
jgi:hypothetical protein